MKLTKRKLGSVKIIVDNSYISTQGGIVFEKKIADKWVELQKWFIQILDVNDRIAVIQGGATMKFQMTKIGKDIGLDKIEMHFYNGSYMETKLQAYQYLGISYNSLIDNMTNFA
ncbi:hypothetical protein LJR153_007192 [Paenibacillus sp. LjRoot153]|uniref:hypothetical protein n=1 Tax=Paenibacillus sp. LjRoot153 TaxID=3342270 RepID=UPI003ECEC8D6